MNITTLNTEQLTMSSREIADITGKSHSKVMRDIRDMIEHLKQNPDLDFVCNSSSYVSESSGQTYPCYELDRDTTECLLTGYSAVLRMKVIKRWKQLEDLHSQQAPQLPQSFAEALQLAADQAKQIEQQTQVLEHQKKHITGLENLFHSGGTIPQFVKQLNGVHMNKINTWLCQKCNWLYDSNAGKVYQSGPKAGQPKPHHWRCTSYARDKYLTERPLNINTQGMNPLTKYEVTLLADGKKWLYKKYINKALPMKTNWNGEYTHEKDLA